MEREELVAWLRLAGARGVGPVAARRLLTAFGLPGEIFRQTPDALSRVVSAAQAQALVHGSAEAEAHAQADRTMDWLDSAPAQLPRRVIALGDPRYPAALLQAADPPLLLWACGQWPDTGWPAAVAVVGSRNPTPQGQENARAFSQALAAAGCTVVSGLARGIDGAAHAGALDGARPGQLATVAVVGTGLDRVYPAAHRELAGAIARHGLLLSEYPLGTGPLPQNFPKRNRIIAALSQGTLVVEAALQSGSLITARLACELGREVYAIPGSIHSVQARGCHALLRDGAKLVESAQDVLEDLAPALGQPPATPAAVAGTGRSSPLLDALGWEPVSLDGLQARTGEQTARLQAALLDLELAGELARLPGGLFQRIARA